MSSFEVPAIFRAVDKFSSPLKKMSSSTTASMAKMERNFRKVEQRAFSVARQSAGVGLAIAAPLGILANEAVKFEASMSNVNTLLDSSTEDINKIGEEVLGLSTKLPVPIEELTAGLYDVRSAGVSAEDSISTLEESGKLATAGLSDVSEATNITTSAINAFKSEGLEASQITDILFKTVKAGKTTIAELSNGFGANAAIVSSAKVELADFQAATAALTTVGTPASQAQNQIKDSIISLQKPSKEMIGVFEALGVTSEKELIQKSGSLVGAFNAVNEQIEKQGLNAAVTWRSTEALAAVTSLTGETNIAYTKTLDDMRHGSNALDEAFKKQLETGKSQMQIAKNNMQQLSITLGTAVIPVITELISAIMPTVKAFGEWAKNNKKTVATIVKIASAVAGLSFAISAVSTVVGVASKVIRVITAVQWLWNAALSANPIGLMIIAVASLAVGVYALSKAFSTQSKAEELANETRKRALENSIDQRVAVEQLFNTLRKQKEGTEEYAKTLAKIEEMQPGITKQYNLQAGGLDNINRAEKALTESIVKRAEAEVRAEMIKEKLKEAIQTEDEGIGYFESLGLSNQNMVHFLTGGGAGTDMTEEQFVANKAAGLRRDADILEQQANEAAEDVSTKETREENRSISETKEKQELTITVKGDADQVGIESSGGNFAMPSTSQTGK